MSERRRHRISSKTRGRGIGAKLGVYDDVFLCLAYGANSAGSEVLRTLTEEEEAMGRHLGNREHVLAGAPLPDRLCSSPRRGGRGSGALVRGAVGIRRNGEDPRACAERVGRSRYPPGSLEVDSLATTRADRPLRQAEAPRSFSSHQRWLSGPMADRPRAP